MEINKYIRLVSITKIYKKKIVLNNINLTFNLGKCYMLVGENGSGKSTILKLITGLIYPSKGLIDNSNLTISYVPEKVSLPMHVKVIDFLNILKEIKQASDEKINYLIDYFELSDAKNKKLKELSKGMLQKVLIIQSLMVDTDVYIFDEVLNGLDKNNQDKFINLLNELKSKNKLVLITSHYSDYYKNIVDEVIDLNKINNDKSM